MHDKRPPRAVFSLCGALALLLLAALPGTAQLQPRGGELQLNLGTEAAVYPSVAALPAGGFIVVWATPTYPIWFNEAKVGRFDALGSVIGTPMSIDASSFAFFDVPKVDTTADGGAVIVWPGVSQNDNGGIQALRLDAAGTPIGQSFQVNTYTTNAQYFPALAVQDDGAFMVVWQSYEQDGDESGLFARTFDSLGAAISADFQIDVYTVGRQRDVAVAALPDGKFVVAWHGGYYEGDPLFARRFDADGVAQSVQFQVSAATAVYPDVPTVAAADDGAFVVVWEDSDSVSRLRGRLFDASGSPLGAEIDVASGGTPWRPNVAMSATGEFQVVWIEVPDDGHNRVIARSFDADGNTLATEFQVNARTTTSTLAPDVAITGAGQFVVVWTRITFLDEYNGRVDIVARRYAAAPPVLDIDGDGEAAALTDATLLLRQRMSFTGSALTAGAVAAACTRCESAEIESYIASILDQLDVDGDGTVGPLTDALLVLRFAFGFRGEALITDAIGEECTRCDAESITAFLAPLFA